MDESRHAVGRIISEQMQMLAQTLQLGQTCNHARFG
jgi:hypothetical protein